MIHEEIRYARYQSQRKEDPMEMKNETILLINYMIKENMFVYVYVFFVLVLLASEYWEACSLLQK